ncbi:glycerol-3-phosphate 1-O-acyltransferase PlsB [Shewanella yunxiaonensis]|uniref:Glycerol-3-phosphate acyltransferase n=1 Tax=Shewanella yunxiaonensis TaxID=2829809 RepID=A0ABX7YUD3_9GAMM|nr:MULTISPECIES: glycerol-3-phosphate 1-O-acyltransferase PlsB [Shewanella]MDF0534651.1 glycerol-3-phosphate 1-O-acyltransferase PlsB [Shewanella sp. A32]QUN05975.1 glycerol-3-phosphate 1-O-acyltransferase PlsB [Shewanella yunxiaonensis]
MSKQDSIWRTSLRWLQRQLVHTVVVPQDPFTDLNLDPSKPMAYVVKTESLSDIAALADVTDKLGLPSPYAPLVVGDEHLPRVVCLEGAKPLFGSRKGILPFLNSFTQLLNLHKSDRSLDIQLVPVSLYWGRTPGKEDDSMRAAVFERENPTWLRKFLMILFLGRDNFVQFSNAVSLRFMADEHGTDQAIAHKLSRVARVHFRRQRKVMTGPVLPNRQALFADLLQSENLIKAIKEEADSKKSTEIEARSQAEAYLDEIAADYSDSLIRVSKRLLTLLWHKLYRGISIRGAEHVRQLHHDGHEIVYVPCHRSHMDYLLLSYLLYFEGMVPPHIAAGINLNFWPAGPLFRRGGAFFIRRSFNGNKLYTAVFKEYLDQLFAKGYSVEYFTEGGRSRTGRLLSPKTGMLAMTVNSVLRGIDRPVTLVPVYLGYDHVMEVATYLKELSGRKKQKESVWQVLGAVRKLGNFGRVYVNFGEPINLQSFLTAAAPDWRDEMSAEPDQKPVWLTPMVNNLASRVMTHINDAAAATSVALISLVLLSTKQHALARKTLEAQLDFYLDLLQQVPYTSYGSVAEGDGHELLRQGIELNKFCVDNDGLGDIVSIDEKVAITMTYYRNNVLHLFAIPALVASCLLRAELSSREQLRDVLPKFFALLQAELFMGQKALPHYIDAILQRFEAAGYLTPGTLKVTESGINTLGLLAETMGETLQRYAIIFNLLSAHPEIERGDLESESHLLASRLGALHGITAPEFYDKKLYAMLSIRLKELGYLCGSDNQQAIHQMRDYTNLLLRPEIRKTIEDSIQIRQES